MELFKRKNSNCWWYDFAVRGERYRGSTKEKNKTAAQAKAARLLTDIIESRNLHCGKKAPVLSDFADRFLAYLVNTKIGRQFQEVSAMRLEAAGTNENHPNAHEQHTDGGH